MVFKTMIDGKVEIISDEYTNSVYDVAGQVKAMSKNGNLLLLMRKYQITEAGKTPVMRWAVFEFNPATKQYVLKLKWETDNGDYVSPYGSRFQDHPSESVKRRGTLRAHLEYQRIANRGARGTARFRKEQGEEHYRRMEARLDDATSYPVKHDRRYMQKIARDFTDKPEDTIIYFK